MAFTLSTTHLLFTTQSIIQINQTAQKSDNYLKVIQMQLVVTQYTELFLKVENILKCSYPLYMPVLVKLACLDLLSFHHNRNLN